jgi:hypothetical protein
MKRAKIKAGTKLLKSHMFVVEKYLADGSFGKMKARLEANGRDQYTEMYPDKSSPTVAVHSVFTESGVASSKPWQIVIKIDIKVAFVQMISKYVIGIFPDFKTKWATTDACIHYF